MPPFCDLLDALGQDAKRFRECRRNTLVYQGMLTLSSPLAPSLFDPSKYSGPGPFPPRGGKKKRHEKKEEEEPPPEFVVFGWGGHQQITRGFSLPPPPGGEC